MQHSVDIGELGEGWETVVGEVIKRKKGKLLTCVLYITISIV
jgi:hypothetical protein